MTFFSENDDFMKETKLCREKKKYSESETSSEESDNTSNLGDHVGKRRQNAKFRAFYWKSRVKQILSDPTKV
jgi:hypothetical protein